MNLFGTDAGGILKQKGANFMHKFGFWFLIFFLCGFLFGVWGSFKFHTYQLHQSKILGGILIEGKPYNLQER